MEAKIRKKSFFKRIVAAMLVIYFILILLMVGSNAYAIHVIRTKIHQQFASSLDLNVGKIEDILSSAERYFYSLTITSANPNLYVIESNKKDPEFYVSLAKMKNELETALTTMDLLDGLFVFPKSNQMLLYSSTYNNSNIASTKLREVIRTVYSDGTIDTLTKEQWFPIHFNSQYYLLRICDTGQSYVGGWVNVSSLITYIEDDAGTPSRVILSYEDGSAYDNTAQITDIVPDAKSSTENYTFLEADTKYLVLSHSFNKTIGGYLSVLVPDSLITDELTNIYALLLVTGIIFIVMIIVLAYVLVNFLQKPIGDLKTSIDDLRRGNFGTRVSGSVEYEEFSDINSAFNEMAGEIKTLKIDVYEEKINKQKIEFKFLKSQVAPHFLVNCMNAIHNLVSIGKIRETQDMAISLGDHLRYALSKEATVPVKKEIDFSINYVKISNLRYADCIQVYTDVDPGAENAAILPMTILTFVENTVKYQVEAGVTTEIHIEVRQTEKEKKSYVKITVWDNGEGWTEENLHVLENGKMLESNYGHHIGIQNTYYRLEHYFGEDFSMHFTNREGAGAQIDMEFPAMNYESKENGDEDPDY